MQEVSAEHNRNTKSNTVPNANANTNTHANADTEINITETKDRVGAKPNAAAGVSTSNNVVLNICTEDDPDPVKQQQENPQSSHKNILRLRNTAKVKNNIAELRIQRKN